MNENVKDIIRKAFLDGNVCRVTFYSDGSGVDIEYLHPTAYHGVLSRKSSSFKMQDAIQILAGFRLKQF